MAGDATWLDSMPEVYHRCLGPAMFEPFARHVAAVAAGHSPGDVLELAAGTGIVTEQLLRALPDARITATDLNPAMVAWAAHRLPGPSWRAADAQSLDFPDASFDLVVCQFGVMFFPDKPAAFAQTARVLRPGAAVVFTVWDTVETSHFPSALMAGLAGAVPTDPPDFVVRIPHGYHDAERIRRDVEAGGLVFDGIERVVLRGHAPSARAIAEGFCAGTPLRFALLELGDLDELTRLVAEEMTRRLGPGPVQSDLAGYVVSAHRPR
jgi:SAM-dependent methyltransferase